MLQAHITMASQVTEHIPVLRFTRPGVWKGSCSQETAALTVEICHEPSAKVQDECVCTNLHRFTGLFEFVCAIAAHFCAVNLTHNVMAPWSSIFFFKVKWLVCMICSPPAVSKGKNHLCWRDQCFLRGQDFPFFTEIVIPAFISCLTGSHSWDNYKIV